MFEKHVLQTINGLKNNVLERVNDKSNCIPVYNNFKNKGIAHKLTLLASPYGKKFP